MSLIQGTGGGLGGAGAPGGALASGSGVVFSHTVTNSARFSDDNNSTLIFTPGTPSSTSVWTMSVWMKKYDPDASGSANEFFSAGTSGSAYSFATFSSANQQFVVANEQGGAKNKQWYNRIFRDPAAWFHLVLRSDLGESIQDDRLRFYINGDLQESTSDGITMTSWSYINASGVTQNWGGKAGIANGNPGCNFYLADINFTDGQSYEPTEFGETVDGVWVPKNPSVTYGNNGYRLEFKQTGTGGASSSTIGADTSGNDNHFTDSGFSAHDIVSDSPTNNFTTFSPIDAYNAGSQLSNANLTYTGASANDGHGATQTFDIANDKFYWEVYIAATNSWIGIISESFSCARKSGNVYSGSGMYAINPANGYKTQDPYASSSSFITAASAGDVIGFACGDGKITIYYNGVSKGDMFTSLTGRYKPFIMSATSAASTFNFGQDHTFNGNKTSGSDSASDANGIGVFYDTPPTGFLALCTSNMSDPAIGPGQTTQADDNFNNILYSGSDFVSLHVGAGGARRPVDTVSIANSLRFDDSSLHRDITSSGNTQTWTWSAWVKRARLGNSNGQYLFTDGKSSSLSSLNFDSSDRLYAQLRDTTGGSSKYKLTNRKFKSLSTWYHIVWRVDTTQSTAADRSRIYINGTQITDFDTEQNVDQNDATTINASGNDHLLGAYNTSSTSRHFEGYMAEVNFADGQSYGPETFGQVGANGDWIPKTISGVSYGTNGFRLTFENSSYLGYDYQTSGRSGTTNDFDVTDNIDSHDQVIDSPTQNFAILDHETGGSAFDALTEGGLQVTGGSGVDIGGVASRFFLPAGVGKWYWEILIKNPNSGDNYPYAGVSAYERLEGNTTYGTQTRELSINVGKNATFSFNTTYVDNVSSDTTGVVKLENNDVLGIAIDMENKKMWFSDNGTFFNSGNPANGTNSQLQWTDDIDLYPSWASYNNYGNDSVFNFGQDPTFAGSKTAPGTAKTDANGRGSFLYDVPAGYLAVVDDNYPQEGIISPDWVWIKQRSATASHYIFDTVRGAGKDLHADSTAAEASSAETLISFDSQGFTVGRTTDINDRADNYVAWTWKAGGPAPTQTYEVKVVDDSGNKYRFDDFGTSAVTLTLQQGGTYTFDQSDSTNDGHPLRFSTTSDGTHGGGSQYTVGVTTTGTPGTSGAKTVITVAWGAPTLYYYCTQHSGMGGQVNTIETRGSTNLKGSLPSVVSANTAAGFSIITWTANSDSGTVGHGLNSAPELVLAKPLGSGTNWYVMHTPGGVVSANNVLNLDSTTAAFNPGVNHFNDTYPTASVISYGGYLGDDLSNDDKVAYCFHSVEGYSKISHYKGNGNPDGPMVNLGHRPAFILIKNASSSSAWYIFDVARNTYNVMDNYLRPNLSNAEGNLDFCDFVSNGFKIRSNASEWNGNGNNIIVVSFAEQPFKFANAR